MKKIIYLMLGIVLLSGASFAKKIPITISNDPVNGLQMVRGSIQHESLTAKQALPFVAENQKSERLPDFLQAAVDTSLWVIFQTRLHDYPENMNEEDTARVLTSRLDATQKWYIGDRSIPTRVVDQNNNTLFMLNGFAQFCPSIQYYFPQLTGGTFTIDTVRFTMYSYPNSPVSRDILCTVVNFPSNAGTSQFTGINTSLNDMIEDVTDFIILSADSINAKTVKVTQNTFNIRPTFLELADRTEINSFPSNNTFGFILFKDDQSDYRDTLSMIGAWEWGLTDAQRNHCFASTICVYPTAGQDTVRTLFTTIAPPQPLNPAAWPQVDAQNYHKMNFTFLIKGFYEGVIDPGLSVEEMDKEAEGFNVEAISPNPATDITKVEFSLIRGERISMNIYNSLGQNVMPILNEFRTPGTYSASFDVSNLPSGTYFLSMTSNTNSVTRTLQIVR